MRISDWSSDVCSSDLLGGVARLFFGEHVVTARTATAVASGSGGEAGAVLQATGYITARRQDTVSAQITGTPTAALIEDGDHVSAGHVLARLDASGYKAYLVAANAQALTANASASGMNQ